MPDTAGTPGANPGQGDGDPPKFVTEDQLNRAITARFTDFSKKQEKHLGDFSTSLTSRIEELMKPPSTSSTPAESKNADDPIVRGLQKQLQDLTAKADKAASEAAAEREKSRKQSLRQTLTDTLLKNGVDAARVKHAVGFLVDAEGRVRYQEGGDDLVFTDTDGSELDLHTGVKSWVGSEDGKFYLPARGITGSGDRGTGNPPKAAGKSKPGAVPTNAELGNSLLEYIGSI